MRGDEKLNQSDYSSNGAEGSRGIKEIKLIELGQRLDVRNKEKVKGNYQNEFYVYFRIYLPS